MGDEFGAFLDMSITALLKLCTQTKKIVANAAADTMFVVIEVTKHPDLLAIFEGHLSAKHKELRRFVAMFVTYLVGSFEPKLLEASIHYIETCLSKGLIDASSEVRLIMRDCYRNYAIKFPEKARQ